MRYPRDHKERTRDRIVSAASRRFRQQGGPGAAIAGLMRDLRLTHGGFYRHFTSKDQLFEEALQASVLEMASRVASMADAAPPQGALKAIIDAYLSVQHCDHPADGCPLAALGTDIARLPRRSRDVCQRILMSYAGRMARYMPGATDEDRERRAAVLFSSMAGTLTLARTIGRSKERELLLADARVFHFAALGG